MSRTKGLMALAGAAAGIGAGVAFERSLLRRRRRNDPAAGEQFGRKRGERSQTMSLPDGASIFIEESGPESDTAVVFVHGSALRTDLWYYQMDAFPGRRLVFYDMRGHGLSQPKGDAPYTIKTLADDLCRVISHLRLEHVVVVGHSVGGMIALTAALERPELLGGPIDGLVLANSTHRPAAETLIGGAALSRVERVTRRPFDFIGNHSDRIEYLRRIIRPSDAVFWTVSWASFGPGASAKHVDFTYDMLAETSADVIVDLIKAYRDYDVTDQLGSVRVPALIIGGTHDRLTVSEASRFLAEQLPKADLKMLSGCGHMSMLERSREFNSLLEDFLKDVIG